MSLRTTSTSVIGATLVLALGATVGAAQTKPTSTKRIPVTKEAAGEVIHDTLTRTDTVTVTNYRTDTLYRTVTRVDTVMPPRPPVRLPNGFYFGVAGGASMPEGSLYIPNSMGYIGQAQLGWQNAKQVFGARLSGSYTGLGQDTRFAPFQETRGQLWTASADLKLQAPLGRPWGSSPRLNIYAIGGYTHTWYRNLPFALNEFDVNGVRLFSTGDNSWNGRSGWDAGGGLSFLWRRTEVFVESRVMAFRPNDFFFTDLDRNIRADYGYQVPIVFGVNWY